MRANTITLVGNVAVTRGSDVLKGDRLVVNMTTGVSRVESDKHRGVSGFFQSSGGATLPQPGAMPQPPGKDAAKPAAPAVPAGRSSRIY
jgi:lipopolysaccharide export system protein LptA